MVNEMKTYNVKITKFDYDLEMDEKIGPWSTFTKVFEGTDKWDVYGKFLKWASENEQNCDIGLDLIDGDVNNGNIDYVITEVV